MAQKSSVVEKKWEQSQKGIEYGKDPKRKEPKDWWSNGPHYYSESSESENTEPKSNDFQENIERSRKGKGGGKSTEKQMQDPEMIEPPEFDPPEIDEPDIDVDAPDPTKIAQSTWKMILFALIFVAVIAALYFWLRKQNSNPKFIQEFDDDWNPEIITKSELELRLENALLNENYREAVRVYFTLILQELIALEYIQWKREKTNHDYLRELKHNDVRSQFWQSVRVFDLVWYGEYLLDKSRFEKIQPHFLSYLEKLKAIKR
jgi:hypothetical protein